MRLGLSSHAYAWAIGVPGFPQPTPPLTALRLLELARELNVRVVQIADNLPLHELDEPELAALASFAQRHALSLEVGTRGIEPEQLRTYLALAQRFGSPILRTLLDSPQWQPTVAEAVATLRGLMPEFAAAGVTLAIENHDRFPARVLAEILDAVDSRRIGLCLDTANSLGCGEGLETVLTVLGPRVVNLHVKDITAERLPHQKGFLVEGCPAGRGLINVPDLLAVLQSQQRDPSVIVELWVTPSDSITETVTREAAWAAESVRYLRQWITD